MRLDKVSGYGSAEIKNKKRICMIDVLLLLIIAVIVGCVLLFSRPHDMTGKNCIRISNSYCIWSPKQMKLLIQNQAFYKYGTMDVENILNRGYISLYIEWWGHNLGYYITKPLCFIEFFRDVNTRCKDVDLESW